MYLLIEYREHNWWPGCAHLHCLEVHEDYNEPVIIMETPAQLVEWVQKEFSGANITVNGSTIYVERFSYNGDSKGVDIYHITKVELGKVIVF